MEYLIGVVFVAGVGIFTLLLGMARDRALYPAILIVIAASFSLFAVMGAKNRHK